MGLLALGFKECPTCGGAPLTTKSGKPKTCPECEGRGIVKAG